MKRRNEFEVMGRLIGLVKPLAGYMALAVLMGLAGHLCAAFLTVFGEYAALSVLGFDTPLGVTALFALIMCGFIGSFHWTLGLLALGAYVTVGVLLPLAVSRLSGDGGQKLRTQFGDLSAFVLDSLRGPGQPGQHPAKHLCCREPGAGHSGRSPGGGRAHRAAAGELYRRGSCER